VVQAEIGIEKLRSEVDTLIVIPNDRLLSISDRHVSVLDAFKAADQVLLSGVQGITDLITTPGLINLDFADVKSVMSGAGSALMGTGSSRGDDRAVAAAEMAISSPLLEASIDGAHGVLLSIQGGSDLGLFEINEAAQLVSNSAAVDANIIFGAVIDDALGDEVRVTVIAAGLDEGRSPLSASAASALESDRSSYTISGSSSPSSSDRPSFGAPPTGTAAGHGHAEGDATGAPRHGRSDSASAEFSRPGGDGLAVDPAAVNGNGTFSSGPPAVAAHGHGTMLAAPVMDATASAAVPDLSDHTGTGSADAVALETPRPEAPRPEAPRPEWVPAAGDASEAPTFRPSHAEAATKTFDVPTTRRRPVVFEEDDDLDVPDFLK
jgi:cell division protein FtsZ